MRSCRYRSVSEVFYGAVENRLRCGLKGELVKNQVKESLLNAQVQNLKAQEENNSFIYNRHL